VAGAAGALAARGAEQWAGPWRHSPRPGGPAGTPGGGGGGSMVKGGADEAMDVTWTPLQARPRATVQETPRPERPALPAPAPPSSNKE